MAEFYMKKLHPQFSLGDYFPPLDSKISRRSISESSLLKVRQYADSLAGQVSDFFGFECPLAANDHAVDLLFCCTQLGCHAKILAGQHKSISMPAELLQMSAWRKVREFCVDWENPSSGFYKQILNIWLEFDIGKSAAPYIPSIFFGVQPPDQSSNINSGPLLIIEALEKLAPEALEGNAP